MAITMARVDGVFVYAAPRFTALMVDRVSGQPTQNVEWGFIVPGQRQVLFSKRKNGGCQPPSHLFLLVQKIEVNGKRKLVGSTLAWRQRPYP